MNITRDLLDLGVQQKRYSAECITSHKISIVIFIAEYMKLRVSRLGGRYNIPKKDETPPHLAIDFAIITLYLIQSPDLEFSDLYNLLISGKYRFIPGHIDNFLKQVKEVCYLGVSHFMDLNDFFETKFQNTNVHYEFNVHKLSVIGFFVRRFFLAVKKHSFSDIALIHENFKLYYERDQKSINAVPSNDSFMDLTNISKNESSSLVKTLEHAHKTSDYAVDVEHVPCSRKQAELFIATQAALLSANEDIALPPPVLQERIRNLLRNNPGFSEAHFLSYLNCLRVKEFCGALDSLYHSFDRNTGIGDHKTMNFDEKADGFRYAALNLAILHAQFGHKNEAMAALKEAIMKAQESCDNTCLQHALTWMYKLTNHNKELLIERSILKSSDLGMNYNMSLGIQSYTQHAGLHGGKPKYIFEIITKSDVINCQHSIIDLSSNSYAQKAALWQLYGKQELCSLWSQLLLYLKTDHLTRGPTSYNGEGVCQAICNISNLLTLQGEYETAYIVLNHARERFPNEPLSHIWMFSENISCFIQAYHNKVWQKAETAARQMAAIDQAESHLCLAEMFLAKGDYDSAVLHANTILQRVPNSDVKNKTVLKIRAMILLVELKCTRFLQSNVSAEVIILLNEALTLAEEYYLQYYVALIHLHMAHVQLWLEMPSHAIKLIDKAIGVVLAHGGRYDRARAMLLYVKCMVARANTSNDPNRNTIILKNARLLYDVKDNFEKIQAYSRVKDVLYLQAKLFDYVRSFHERNKCAADFKVFNERYPSASETSTLLTGL